MADIIRTIGASGADFTTLSAWWTARSGVAGDKYIGVLIDATDYVGGEFSGVYAGDSIELRAAAPVALDLANPTAPHARIIAGAAHAIYWRCIKPTTLKGIEIFSASTTQNCVRVAAFEDTNVTLELCWVRGGADGVSHIRAAGLTKLKNCVVSDAFTFGVSNAAAGVTLENVVLARCNTSNTSFRGGCRRDVAGTILSNVVAVGSLGTQFQGTAVSATMSYCASSDTTAAGSNALTGVTTAAFTNYAGNIFTAATDGVLDNTGPSSTDRGINLSAADSITISSVSPWQLFARNKLTNTGSIPVSGTYSGAPTAIEARFNGGAWVVVSASPTGGSFSGTLTGLASGNGALEVRFANNTAITDSVSNIAIGAKLLFWGQSNFSGRANNPQMYTGTAGWFHKYTVTNNTWQQGADPFDTDTASGSIFPLLANSLVAQLGCPVAFVGVAAGSTTLAQWQSGQTLNTRMLSYISSAAADGLEGICSWIGESDASAVTPEADFKSRYNAVINQLKTLTGTNSMLVSISGLDNAAHTNVRQWINDVAASNVNASDTVVQIWPLYQKIHYETNAETALAAGAIFDGLVDAFYSSPPTGTITIDTIVPNSTGATVPFTYSASDQTGFEYQINDTGTIYPVSASPATPTGLTPSTGYTIRVRAVNGAGESDWSTSAPFTTSGTAIPVTVTLNKLNLTLIGKPLGVSVGTVVSYEGLLNKTSLMLHGGVLNVTNGHNIPYVATINKTSIPLDSKQLVFYTQVNTPVIVDINKGSFTVNGRPLQMGDIVYPIIESARVFFIKRRR